MREALILALAIACGSCAFDRSGLGGGGAGGPTGDETGTTDGDAGPIDPVGDPYPTGAVSFFDRASCPPSWALFEAANGRTIVPTIGSNPPGTVNGEPLASGEDRTHVHKWSTAVAVSKFEFASFDGDNNGVGGGGNIAVSGTTEPASSGIPYAQMLVCKKTGGRGKKSLPSGMQVYFDAAACPAGFHQSEETQGRVIVGLPSGAGADQTFGAAPMWGTGPRPHAHGLEAAFDTSSYGMAVVSGCCNGGFASNGKYTMTALTEATAATLPWVELVGCTKD